MSVKTLQIMSLIKVSSNVLNKNFFTLKKKVFQIPILKK